MGHVPHDDRHLSASPDDAAEPHHDADVKLPGRHYPRLPYTVIDPYSVAHPRHPHTPVATPPHHSSSSSSNNNNNYGGFTNPAYSDYWDYDDGGGDGDWVGGGGEGHLKTRQSDTSGSSAPSSTPEPRDPSPRFDRLQPRSVTVQAGKTAVLVCRVLSIGDKSVSWIRHEDLHILTVDKYKYSTDNRLSVMHNEAEHEWLLKIQSVTQQDAGMYECQVSTKPLLSFIVNLEVLEASPLTTPFPSQRDAEKAVAPTHQPEKQVPSATILSGPEIHVHRGSLINLTCVVEHTTERPLYVVWYHYNEVIDYENLGGVVVVTQVGQRTVSHMLVKEAKSSDSGKYTCQPSNGEDAHVTLHVLDGEHPGALQTNGGRRGLVTPLGPVMAPPLLLLLLLLLCAPC